MRTGTKLGAAALALAALLLLPGCALIIVKEHGRVSRAELCVGPDAVEQTIENQAEEPAEAPPG